MGLPALAQITALGDPALLRFRRSVPRTMLFSLTRRDVCRPQPGENTQNVHAPCGAAQRSNAGINWPCVLCGGKRPPVLHFVHSELPMRVFGAGGSEHAPVLARAHEEHPMPVAYQRPTRGTTDHAGPTAATVRLLSSHGVHTRCV